MLRHMLRKVHKATTMNHTDLRTYTSALPHGGMAAFAKKIKVTPIYLSQLAARQDGREPSAELAVLIEKESGGEVPRWLTRPSDWMRIWPELIGNPGAPLASEHGELTEG